MATITRHKHNLLQVNSLDEAGSKGLRTTTLQGGNKGGNNEHLDVVQLMGGTFGVLLL